MTVCDECGEPGDLKAINPTTYTYLDNDTEKVCETCDPRRFEVDNDADDPTYDDRRGKFR